MTIINRALLKAYERHADSVAASELDQHPSAVVRGWARKLREPIRGREEDQPATDVATQGPVQEAPVESITVQQAPIEQTPIVEAAEIPAVILNKPDGTTLRFDPPHPPVAATSPISPAPTSPTPTPSTAPTTSPTSPTPTLSAAPTPAPSTSIQPTSVPPTSIQPTPIQLTAIEPPATAAVPTAAPQAAQAEQNFSWPKIVERLLACPAADEVRELADRMHELAADCDLRCVAFSGPGRRAGRTSLIVTLAWVLSEEKSSRVAIVDAHFDNPGLAQVLSFRPSTGIGDVFSDDDFDPAEAATRLSEKLTIAPLVERVPAETIDRDGIGSLQSLLRSLRRDHDLVLVDAGAWDQADPPPVLECRAIDAFVGITRFRTSAAAQQVGEQDLEQLGIEWLGQVETFVPAGHA